jgi:luciferase family oxidoreductase group 1
MALQLSVLDQSPVPEGCSPGDALRNSIDLARLADDLGYHRYWVAEHHGTAGLACHSPEVLIGPIASATKNIRVGSGGIMLPHYSPFKVAESFSMLAGLYPDRIDLGLGRAAGTSPAVARRLQRDKRMPPPDDFRQALDELIDTLSGPRFTSPDIYLLGSSPDSSLWAEELQLPYVFADFINPGGAPIARAVSVPRQLVACWAICADTDEEAMRLSYSFRMMMTMLFRGQSIPVPTVEKAEEFLRAEGTPLDVLPIGRRILTGTPQKVRNAIEQVADSYGAEEVLLVNILHDHTARRRSYELIAEAFR